MKLRTLSALLIASSAAVLAVGCAATAHDEEAPDGEEQEQDITARVTPGTFKLYDAPHAAPDASCDLHTKLELSAGYYSVAKLENALTGTCELASPPADLRQYRLRLDSTSCGTRIYAGTRKKDGQTYAVKITDNRARICEDVVAAAVIVEETRPDGAKTTLYSGGGPAAEAFACPPSTYVNCMPPTNNGLCSAAGAAWVEANCPGVEYVY